jgi:tryptophanyl-tRNA synthetase
MKKRILTGDRPTGKLHLGHYVGSLKSRVELQNEYDMFILIANIQALTDNFNNPHKVSSNIIELMKDYLAVGLDPNKVSFILESDISEIADLTIIFSNLVTLSRALRNPTVKSEIIQKEGEFEFDKISIGFLSYPINQSADIAAFNADLVPAGEDQESIIEQSREIIKKFNKLYGEILNLPKIYLTETPRLVGIDGTNKMSKSLNNTINLGDSEDELKSKVMKMYTDPTRIHKNDPGHIEGNAVFLFHDIFNLDKDEVKNLKELYIRGKIGDIEVKEKLYKVLNDFIAPIREKRLALDNREDYLLDILRDGTKLGKKIAHETLSRVRDSIELNIINK